MRHHRFSDTRAALRWLDSRDAQTRGARSAQLKPRGSACASSAVIGSVPATHTHSA
jgi:hypothetical protein